MDFGYLQDIYDGVNSQLFDSTFAIMATVNIAGEDIGQDFMYTGYGDNLDGRHVESLKTYFSQNVSKNYRIKVFPLEPRLKSGPNDQIDYDLGAKHVPYDRWVSCFQSVVNMGDNKTIFDYTKDILIKNITYTIKGVVNENFGNKPIVHVFLVKEAMINE